MCLILPTSLQVNCAKTVLGITLSRSLKESPETRVQSRTFQQNPGTSTQMYQEIIWSMMKHLLCLVKVQRKKSSQGLYPIDSRFPELHFQIFRTIGGHKTAISDFLRFHTQENFNENFFLHKLIKCSSRKPQTKNVFQKWDTVTIFNFLNQPLFEPLSEA